MCGLFFGTMRYWMLGRSKPHDEVPGLLQTEPRGDLLVGGLGGGGGQRDPRHLGPALVEHGQREVVGPEVVAPLGDTVRLVDGEERHLAPVEEPLGALGAEALGSQIEQVELVGEEGLLDGLPLVRILGRIEEAYPHPEGPGARPPGPA